MNPVIIANGCLVAGREKIKCVNCLVLFCFSIFFLLNTITKSNIVCFSYLTPHQPNIKHCLFIRCESVFRSV